MSGAPKEKRCPSDLALDRYRLAELPVDQRQQISGHLAACSRCRGRLAAQQGEAAAFGGEMNIPNLAVDALQRGQGAGRRGWARLLRPQWLGAMAAAAAGLILVFALYPQLRQQPRQDALDPALGTRIKGGFSLRYHVKRGARQWPATAADWVEPGDQIRFLINLQSAGYLYIVGIDAARRVTLYEPYAGEAPRSFAPGEGQVVPGAIELDRTLGEEQLLALLCEERLEARAVLAAAKKAAASLERGQPPSRIRSLPFPCAQTSLTLRKRAQGK